MSTSTEILGTSLHVLTDTSVTWMSLLAFLSEVLSPIGSVAVVLFVVSSASLITALVICRMLPIRISSALIALFCLTLAATLPALTAASLLAEPAQLGALIFRLSSIYLAPTLLAVLAVGGVLELLRYSFQIKLDRDLHRFVFLASVFLIIAVAAPMVEQQIMVRTLRDTSTGR